MDSISHIKNPSTNCQECSLYHDCLPQALNKNELKQFEAIVHHTPPIREGEHLFKQGTQLEYLYIIRVGSCKCYSPTIDGRQTISGFYLPGKILGLNATAGDVHPDSAQILETTCVCKISYSALQQLRYQIPKLQKQYIDMMCDELLEMQGLKQLTNQHKAENRLASFLMFISNRMKNRGYCCTDFRMSMARIDIANYLCLANETVSRAFKRFQKDGLIDTNGKYITLLNLDKLNELAGLAEPMAYQQHC